MLSRDFCYWLQGYMEIAGKDVTDQGLSAEQLEIIRKHLNLVFKHEIDPSMGDEAHQEELNQIHNPEDDPKRFEFGYDKTKFRC